MAKSSRRPTLRSAFDVDAPFASYTSSSFYSSPATSSLHRSSSPTRVTVHAPVNSPPGGGGVRFSVDRPISPHRSMAVVSQKVVRKTMPKRTCLCSPTTHPGSFRCNLHKNVSNSTRSLSYSSNRLNAPRSAMTNSLVRLGTVEGDLMKRALAALIRPSSHHQRRRGDFQPRPSRLSRMSTV